MEGGITKVTYSPVINDTDYINIKAIFKIIKLNFLNERLGPCRANFENKWTQRKLQTYASFINIKAEKDIFISRSETFSEENTTNTINVWAICKIQVLDQACKEQ